MSQNAEKRMILAVDVDYGDDFASIAGIMFRNWTDSKESETYKSQLRSTGEYIPGQFYLRELPCILKLIEEHSLDPYCIVIDGFVYLDGKTKPGLGRRLYDALSSDIVIIGVAKNPFKGISDECKVYRGKSKNPLYITSEGVPLNDAKNYIKSMHGNFRVPALLKKVDQLCRGELS